VPLVSFSVRMRGLGILPELLEGCCTAAALTAQQLSSPLNCPPAFDRHIVVIRKVISYKTTA